MDDALNKKKGYLSIAEGFVRKRYKMLTRNEMYVVALNDVEKFIYLENNLHFSCGFGMYSSGKNKNRMMKF